MSKNKQQQLQQWIQELTVKEDSVFKNAVESLSAKGDISVIEPVAKVMFDTKDRTRKQLLAEFFANIEQESAKDELIRVIQELTNAEHQVQLLNTIWNSRMDFSEFLVEFVVMAIDGTLEIAIECHTIIENLDGPFDEADILESKLLLGSYEKHESRRPEKDFLIHDILAFLERMDSDLEA
jgi:hypothetical protein